MEYEKKFGKKKNLKVIPNPLRIEIPKKIVSHKQRPMKIVTVGRLEEGKQPLFALKAFEKILVSVPDATLEIYGTGSLEREIREYISKKGLEDRIFLKGFESDLSKIYSDAAVMLLPTKRETFGLVILEAFAYGVPVVVFSTTFGVDDLIDSGVDGFVVPQKDIDEMAKKAAFLLLNPKIRDEFAANGRKKAGMYTYEKVMPRYFDLIRQVSPVDIDRVELKRNFFKRLDVPQPLLDYITSNYDKEEIETIFTILEKDTLARIVDGRPMLYNEVLIKKYNIPQELFIIE